MKLRIKGDSLRLRLTRSEVDGLSDDGVVKQRMHLSGAVLEYTLRSDSNIDGISANLSGSSLVVRIPQAQALAWAKSEQVSLRAKDGPLQILVEKDFSCLQPREGEDDSDAFPHPDGQING